jgi:hypothetical protein
MAKSWSDVEQSQQYQSLSPQEQKGAKQQYFDNVISSKPEYQSLPQEEQQSARSQFIGDFPKEKPSWLATVARGIMRNSPLEKMNTLSNMASNPELQKGQDPGQIMVGNINYNTEVLKPRETDLARRGTMAQLDVPIAGAMAVSGMAAPVKTAMMLGKYGVLEGARNLLKQTTGISTENIKDPNIRDLADIGVNAAEAGLASLKWIPDSVKNNIAKMALSPEYSPTTKDQAYGHDARRVVVKYPEVTGNNPAETKQLLWDKANEVGQQRDFILQNHDNSNVNVDISNHINEPIDAKIEELNQNYKLNKTKIDKLNDLKIDLNNDFVEGQPKAKNLKTNALGIIDFIKNKISNIVNYTGRESDDAPVNDVVKQIRKNLMNQVNSLVPETKGLNQDYGDLQSAIDASNKIINKTEKQGLPFNWSEVKKLGANNWLRNPTNMMKLAQWLYTAPKEEQSSIFEKVPSLVQAIKEKFSEAFKGHPDVNLGMAGKVGVEPKAVTPEVMPAQKALPYKKRPQITNPSRLLPDRKSAGQSSGPTINQGGEVQGKLTGPKEPKQLPYKPGLEKGAKRVGPENNAEYKGGYGQFTVEGGKFVKGKGVSRGSKLLRNTGVALATAGALASTNPAEASQKSINKEDAILTILGEVGPYGKEGMQNVASAIRNRGTLHGAYGKNNPNVVGKKYTQKQYDDAKAAWEESEKKKFNDANHWYSDADLKKANVQNDIKKGGFIKIRKVGGNTFYREPKKFQHDGKTFKRAK